MYCSLLPPVNLNHIELFTNGDMQITTKLLSIFDDQGKEIILEMKLYCKNNQSDEWRQASHKLKGSASNLGASQLAEYCNKAEHDFEATVTEKEAMLYNIEQEFDRVELYLKCMYSSD